MNAEGDNDMSHHAIITRAGEVDFPLWVKVLAWIIGLAIPVALLASAWIGSTIFDMSVRIARMEGQLQLAAEDRYRASQAQDAHNLLTERIDRNSEDVSELQGLHGRGGTYREQRREQ